MNSIDLNKYVCSNPFTYLDLQFHGGAYMCCPSWLPTDITYDGKSPFRNNLQTAWNGETALKIRESVKDGSYKYCNHTICPSLSSAKSGKIPHNFIHKDKFKEEDFTTPETVLYGQDQSCNLKCPSCRTNVIHNDPLTSDTHKSKLDIQNQVEEYFGNTIKKIFMTGSGDPIYSKLYRNFLQQFDKMKYPNLEKIVIVTNGILLDKKMWDSFSCTEFIDTIDISFDAGTKETYENVTRLNGDWNRLIANTKFLAGLNDRPREFVISMVVSIHNYQEMYMLYNIVSNIFKNSISSYRLSYRQHVHWGLGAYSIDDMANLQVFEEQHPEFSMFIEQLHKIKDLAHVSHNFHHLMEQKI